MFSRSEPVVGACCSVQRHSNTHHLAPAGHCLFAEFGGQPATATAAATTVVEQRRQPGAVAATAGAVHVAAQPTATTECQCATTTFCKPGTTTTTIVGHTARQPHFSAAATCEKGGGKLGKFSLEIENL